MEIKENISLIGDLKVLKEKEENGIKVEDTVSIGYLNATLQPNDMNIHIETRIYDKDLANQNKENIREQYNEFVEVVKDKGRELGMIFF